MSGVTGRGIPARIRTSCRFVDSLRKILSGDPEKLVGFKCMDGVSSSFEGVQSSETKRNKTEIKV